MLTLFMLILILAVLGILGVLIDIARNLRRARRQFDRMVRYFLAVKRGDPHHGPTHRFPVWFSIWCFESGKWTLLSRCGQPGCSCGPPPQQPGSYEGQVIRKECPAR
jgi:hypothetical protein